MTDILQQMQAADQQLLAAAEFGNIFSAIGALKGNASLDATDSKGRNVVHIAAANGQLDFLRFLAQEPYASQVDWEARDEKQNTPVLTAFEYGKPAEAEYLIQEIGVKTDVQDKNGDGILRKAAKQRTDVGKSLLALALTKDDALDNTCNDFGYSALHTMVEMHNMSGLELALLSGADPRLKGDPSQFTPRELAEADNLKAEAQMLGVFEALPKIPDDLSDLTLEKILAENKDGKRLLDNPRLWRRMDEVFDVLTAKGEALPSKEDLLTGGVMGYAPMALAILNNRLDTAYDMLDTHGERLQADDFWSQDHAGISLFGRVAADRGIISDMFTVERWIGESPQALKETYQQLPPEAKEAITNWHTLQAEVQREYKLNSRLER